MITGLLSKGDTIWGCEEDRILNLQKIVSKLIYTVQAWMYQPHRGEFASNCKTMIYDYSKTYLTQNIICLVELILCSEWGIWSRGQRIVGQSGAHGVEGRRIGRKCLPTIRRSLNCCNNWWVDSARRQTSMHTLGISHRRDGTTSSSSEAAAAAAGLVAALRGIAFKRVYSHWVQWWRPASRQGEAQEFVNSSVEIRHTTQSCIHCVKIPRFTLCPLR